MPSEDKESRNTGDDALEVNKETLQDLDVEPADAEDVKGGTYIGGYYSTQIYLSGSVKGSVQPSSVSGKYSALSY